MFLEEFVSETLQERMREEFSQLKQGEGSVAEYAKKFTTLSRFAPDLVVVESRKVKRFISG